MDINMSKNTSHQNNQELRQETIKKLLTGAQANNNISKSLESQALSSEALVERIAEINTIENLKNREQELTKLSDNAASLLGQSKSYMQILIKDTARTMVDENMMQRLKKEIPHISTPMAEEIISKINYYNKEAPTQKQRSAGIEGLAEHAAKNWIGWDKNTSLSPIERSFLLRICNAQKITNLDQRAKSMQSLQGQAAEHNKKAKANDPKINLEKLTGHLENIKTAITEVANNNTNLPEKGILSKISNNIKLIFTQVNISIRWKNDKAKQIKQSQPQEQTGLHKSQEREVPETINIAAIYN
jgi:hypothetical protein